MRLPWRKKARLIEPKPMVCLNFQELQTAKEILAEVFHTRPADVEEMIQRRLETRSLPEETDAWPEGSGEKLWPAAFCVGE